MSSPRYETAKNPSSVVSVGVASGTLVASNPYRVWVKVKNTHATQAVSLNLGPEAAVLGEGIHLLAGEGDTIEGYTGIITAIGAGAATTVAITEL